MGHAPIHGGGREGFALSLWAGLRHEPDFIVPLPAVGVQGAHPLEMAFRRIPRGAFVMGSRGSSDREEPRHRVEIPHDFYLGKYVVTQREWRALVEVLKLARVEPRPKLFGGDDWPVRSVTWSEVTVWCAAWNEWLTRRGHARRLGIKEVRLPAEAEWEHACRAGSDTDYWNGDGEAALREVGWFHGNSGGTPHDVKEDVVPGCPESHPAGLVGMHGHIFEWCGDMFDDGAYRQRQDGWQATVPWARWDEESERFQCRSIRGGSLGGAATVLRSAYRNAAGQETRSEFLGFRVCLVRGPCRGSTLLGGASERGEA